MVDTISAVIEKIASLSERTMRPVIFIAGLGASGKTSLCKELLEHFIGGTVFETDWFAAHESEERKRKIATGEVPQNPFYWYDWDALIIALKNLTRTGNLEIKNAWNQKTGKKDLDIQLTLDANVFVPIFVDGIYLLHPEIKHYAQLRIFLDVPMEMLHARRLARDGHRSSPGYLAQKAEWTKIYDIPYFEKYRNQADITL